MKKSIFLSFSLMLLVSAGVWPQENAFGGKYVNAFKADSVVWKCYNENTHKFCETILHGDTVVDGKKWKILQSNCLIVLKGLIRTEGDKVLFTPYPGYENTVHQDYRKQKETVIYDFSLKVGESIPSAGLAPSGKITKIDSVMFEDGHKHKRIHVGEYYSYIEGLGNDRYSPFFMLAHALPTMPSRPTFMCCHVDNRLLYRNPAFKNCDGQKVSNVIITGGLSEAKVWFSDGQLTVSLEDGRMFNVAVFNAQGMLVAQRQKNRYEARIPFGNEAKGVYFVRIQAGQAVATHKIVHARNK
ncbi:T9SS type A sorting domain-containing protein [Tannerella forsythia]|nr:T9SS type A sorting domain-containing protein [Tannerella forsythia]